MRPVYCLSVLSPIMDIKMTDGHSPGHVRGLWVVEAQVLRMLRLFWQLEFDDELPRQSFWRSM
ncbi:hypothetical protein DPMN_187383 [Dreissena polymorpha]|uniref:Uncharacterized protein n=1 Tax=Dreissena polymorpha TaxID=45954 RepID=A0A9D4IAD6_DREPO|nr:hypothetical protein DPMN_187383 [Dreissena polymorpha]